MSILPNTINLQLPFGVVMPEVNSLMLEYNAHMSSYMTIDDYNDEFGDQWVSPEEHELAVKHNSAWTAHWYPHTPIWSYRLMAYSLEALLKALAEISP